MKVNIRMATAGDIKPLEAVIGQHWKVNVDHRLELRNKDAILLVAERPEGAHRVVGTGLMWIRAWNETGYLVE
ncbi:MAG: hypothetical protein JRM75_04815, partial [Nitrososphaerota archaeon]|nr:hypothetical protein [Nitrososphaerota archaeon]